MHLRPKPWARPELLSSGFFIEEPWTLKGRWAEAFPKSQPLHLELGCGKGQFIAELAHRNPQINYLAIDMIDTVLGLAKRQICDVYGEAPVDNLRLTAWDIGRIDTILGQGDTIERIYINFCNPWPRRRHHKKRLTHPRQLEKYKAFLSPQGAIHFKTDDDALYDASLGYFEDAGFTLTQEIRDLHATHPANNIVTEHERMFSEQGILIKKAIAQSGPFHPSTAAL
ncbi:tRNA (guanine-N(7)-)-methyltransferase [Eubacterium aggregans]|uniref:tRNA (guanine-N(7)-)-methyltransferase n=1 Tax=Eubacterium aggregans TaxID=81409 RepID=A0A1H4AHD2_9FIRM|nr:tRNA (guanosine(46)-N7)-methyltransferase TrmB [Eubacterium aggregans]SEA35340.1 tRNA (guanine-N(7)-)-methyltransferase [Eubacterium aggregans]